MLSGSPDPPDRRAAAFDAVSAFPVPVDLLVYTATEWDRVATATAGFAGRLRDEIVWLT